MFIDASRNNTGTNAQVTHDVGMPLCAGITAFEEGHYETATNCLNSVYSKLNRIGGSRAQVTSKLHQIRGSRAQVTNKLHQIRDSRAQVTSKLPNLRAQVTGSSIYLECQDMN